MEKERERIERMLREGKITKEQSEELLKALEESTAAEKERRVRKPKTKIISISIAVIALVIVGGLLAIHLPKVKLQEKIPTKDVVVESEKLYQKGPNLLKNSGFEEGIGNKPSNWFEAMVPAPGLKLFWDKKVKYRGKASVAIANTHIYDRAVCNNWAQNITAFPIGKRLKLSGYIKTKDAQSVVICVQCWSRDNKMLAFGTTQTTQEISGTTDWTKYTAFVTAPSGTDKITVRAVLTGTGQVWFDDIQLASQELQEEIPLSKTELQREIDREISQLGTGDRFKALNILIKIGEPAVPALIEALQDQSNPFTRRWEAAKALGAIKDERAVEPLIKAMSDENEVVRRVTAEALGRLGDTRAIPVLKEALKDPKYYYDKRTGKNRYHTRESAAEALEKLGIEAKQK